MDSRRVGLLAVAAALAAALAASGARLARRGALPGTGRFARGSRAEETYRCGCGAVYRVSGADRHRVYWPEGAPDHEPVLGDRCVRCDAPLPAEHDTVVA